MGDDFRCVACGEHSSKEILHIDHIKPVSLGGETNLENLRALCGLCNMGRGDLVMEIDFKDFKKQPKSNENQPK